MDAIIVDNSIHQGCHAEVFPFGVPFPNQSRVAQAFTGSQSKLFDIPCIILIPADVANRRFPIGTNDPMTHARLGFHQGTGRNQGCFVRSGGEHSRSVLFIFTQGASRNPLPVIGKDPGLTISGQSLGFQPLTKFVAVVGNAGNHRMGGTVIGLCLHHGSEPAGFLSHVFYTVTDFIQSVPQISYLPAGLQRKLLRHVFRFPHQDTKRQQFHIFHISIPLCVTIIARILSNVKIHPLSFPLYL